MYFCLYTLENKYTAMNEFKFIWMMKLYKGWYNQQKIGKQSIFDQYPLYEWNHGVPIMGDMRGSEDEDLDE